MARRLQFDSPAMGKKKGVGVRVQRVMTKENSNEIKQLCAHEVNIMLHYSDSSYFRNKILRLFFTFTRDAKWPSTNIKTRIFSRSNCSEVRGITKIISCKCMHTTSDKQP